MITHNLLYNYFKYSVLSFFLILSFSSCKGKRVSQKTVDANDSKNKNTSDGTQELMFASKYVDGCAARMKGNVTEALKLFTFCKGINPNSLPVKYELATVYKILGINDLALAYAKECATADPKNEWYQLILIECYHTLKQFQNSVKIQENLVKNFPANSEFKENLAIEYSSIGQYDKAYNMYNDLEKQYGINEQLSVNKIKLLQQENKFNEIEKEINKLIASDTTNSRYLNYLAEHYEYIKQPEKAKQIYEKIIRIDPSNPTVHLALSDYYKQKGKDEMSFSELKLAFLNPELDVVTKYNIALAYFNTSNKFPESAYGAQGFELVKIMQRVHPSAPESNSLYGDYLFLEKKFPDAALYYRVSALKDKSDYQTWEKLLNCNELLLRYDSVEKYSFEAMELFPSQPKVYYYNGFSNLKLRNYKKAVESLKDGLEYIVNDKVTMSAFYTYLGDAYNYLKEYEKSDKAFDDVLKIFSDNEYVLNQYAYYLSVRKDQLEKAEKMSKKCNQLNPNNGSYMDTYGWILFQQGKYAQAEEWLLKATELAKKPNTLEHYGDCLFKLNKVFEAISYWKLSIEAGGDKDRISKKIKEKNLNE